MISASKIDLVLRSRMIDCHFLVACILHQYTTTTTTTATTGGKGGCKTRCSLASDRVRVK